ncbi:hypothetical protein EHRUM3_05140 [Ehrlichia ruminantium]|uniref:Uncharacterized protein n=1 Tax=Ehrlichia ruminantium TaxID=779 RepID=A0A170RTV0_EHRRU|nr:hypothetical protein EHRUM2_04200 [Ehrlichia ruminantium]GAT78297.1 hypothetical protein EHRUM3_05140 [Ehrlichia ruminantium]
MFCVIKYYVKMISNFSYVENVECLFVILFNVYLINKVLILYILFFAKFYYMIDLSYVLNEIYNIADLSLELISL